MSAFRTVVSRLDALSNRERLAVCIAGIAVLYLIIGMLATGPLDARLRGFQRDIAAQREVIAALSGQKAVLEGQLREHPDAPFQEKLARLDAEIRRAEAEIALVSAGLVEPQRMPALVRDLLAVTPGLRLKGMRTLPAVPVSAEETGEPSADRGSPREAQGPTGQDLFKHGIEITVEGPYPALVDYAGRLEALPARVVWNRTRIDAKDYPRVAMTLTLYTLSLERTWLVL